MWPLITEEGRSPRRLSAARVAGVATIGPAATRREGDSRARNGATMVAVCLGGFSLYVRGEAVTPARWAVRNGGRNRVVGVMAYLVAHRHQRVTRERLIDIFWDQADGDRANQSLDRTISALRRALEPGLQKYRQSAYIVGPRDGYRFSNDAEMVVDAEEFIARFKKAAEVEHRQGIAAAAPLYQRAETIYTGPFMEGVPYAELWCHHQRQLLADYHRAALTRLAHFAWLSRDFDRVTSYAHRILGEYGCQGDVCRWLADAYIQQGAPAAARRHVECCPFKQRLSSAPCIDAPVVLER